MPVKENGDVILVTKDALLRMPKPMARRLKLGTRKKMISEFDEWIKDMGYQPFRASPMVRQLLYEAFVGGWGAKIRQIKRNESESESI